MQNCELIRDLFSHMRWADGKIWESSADNEAVRNDEKAISLLAHISIVQYAFLYLWKSQPLNYGGFAGLKNMDEIKEFRRKYLAELDEFLKDLDKMDMDREIVIPWSSKAEPAIGKVPASTRLQDTLMQVTMHSQYHRAQVNSRLRELGIQPPLVDYIAWVWIGKPE